MNWYVWYTRVAETSRQSPSSLMAAATGPSAAWMVDGGGANERWIVGLGHSFGYYYYYYEVSRGVGSVNELITSGTEHTRRSGILE